MRTACQRGFTLIDVLVGAAIAVLVGTLSIAVAHAFVGWTARTARVVSATSAIDRLTDRWDAAAASAWAIFTPVDDVFGVSNADGHEFDIATQDDRRRRSYRAYVYDAARQRLSEYLYATPGDPPTATGDVSSGVTAFAAQTQSPSTLQQSGDALYDPLFARSTIVDADVAVGLGAQALGGNRLTRIHIATNGFDRTVMLASGTAPSSFTIVLTYTPPPT
ncbi:MAG TPA: type II secretion system protein [Verrucomicrobiae bacterium]|jgi:type II secretory pathway pseudopilin PulG|nr:type II secretion system protein [Verrucomicrobiae bacterium]